VAQVKARFVVLAVTRPVASQTTLRATRRFNGVPLAPMSIDCAVPTTSCAGAAGEPGAGMGDGVVPTLRQARFGHRRMTRAPRYQRSRGHAEP
jgi:hypothetical protein